MLCELAAEISSSIAFPFAYLQHSSVVGGIILLCLKASVSSMQVALLNICSDGQVILGYSGRKDVLSDASLYLAAALYRGVLEVLTLHRADHCTLLWQQVLLAPFRRVVVLCHH